MQLKTLRSMLLVVSVLVALGLMLGCAGMEKAPPNRLPGYAYYPKVLVDADKALDMARQQGKDKECPMEFNEAKARVDKAYMEYMACKTPGPIAINIQCYVPAPACNLTSDRNSINLGDSVTLALTTSGKVKSAAIEGTKVETSGGTKTATPTSSTTFTATVEGPGGSTTCSSGTVQVIPPPPPTCELRADKKKVRIEEMQSVILTLTTSGKVTSAMLDGTEVATTGGTKTVNPTSPTHYIAKVEGPGGSNMCSVPVSVSLTLYVHFPFDRPKAREDATWFGSPDADNPTDAKDPANKGKAKAAFMNTRLEDNPKELKKAVDFVKKNPGTLITVIGYTDSIEKKPGYNMALSERRAIAVKEYLIHQHAVESGKIKAKGLGATDPIAKEKTPDGKDDPAGRAKNRRVEIISEAMSPK